MPTNTTTAPRVRWSGPDVRNLDLLRAVAVLCVFLAHLSLFLIEINKVAISAISKMVLYEIGHIGVLFFFVHTALVLMLSLDRAPPNGRVVNFYLRRLFRIYPLAIVCVISVLLFRVPQTPERSYASFNWLEIASNFLLIQNLTQHASIITVLWTLAREVQMYLALPWIYWAVRRISSPITPLILWLSFSAALPYTDLLMWFPCFMGGVFAYQLGRERVFKLPAWSWPIAIFALLALHIVLSLTLLPDNRNDYLMCMFLGAAIPNVADMRHSWLTQAARVVAKYSYGVYLFHFHIIWFSFIVVGWLPPPVHWAVFILLMVGIPVLGYHLVEGPCMTLGQRIAARFGQPRSSDARQPVVAH